VNLSGNKFASSASYEDSIKFWGVDDGYKLLKRLDGHTKWVAALCFSAKDNVLLSGSFDQTIRFWDIETYECLKVLETNYNENSQIFLLPNGYIVFEPFIFSLIGMIALKYMI
jgi:WD40 repeat protein